MQREDVLNRAKEIVTGHRTEAYGSPEDNFKRIASYWSTYLNHEITTVNVADMMILLKMARNVGGTGSIDNYIDIAGYAACAGEIFEQNN